MDATTQEHRDEPRATWESGIPVGSLLGMRVLVHWRVLLALAAATGLASPLSPVDVPAALGLTRGEFLFLSLPMMLLSTLGHELGHAFAGRALGLEPRSIFIDLLGGHTVARLGTERARDQVVYSLAGPAVNLVAWLLLGRLAGDLYAPLFSTGSPMAVTASYNMFVLLSNVLPLTPRDGYRTYSAMLWSVTGDRVRAGRLAAWTGPLLVAVPAIGAVAYLWLSLDETGWAAVIALGVALEMRGSFGGGGRSGDRIFALRVTDLMAPGLRTRPEALARSLVDDRVRRKHSPDLSRLATLDLPYVVITDEGQLLGMLTPGEVEQLALRHLRWDSVSVAEVMTPASKLATVGPEEEGFTALVYMIERRLEALLVVEAGEPVGCVTAKRLMEALEDEPAPRGAWQAGAGDSPTPPRTDSGSQLSLFEDGGRSERTDAA